MIKKQKIQVRLKTRGGKYLLPQNALLNKRLTSIQNTNLKFVRDIKKYFLKSSFDYKCRLQEFNDYKHRQKKVFAKDFKETEFLKPLLEEYKNIDKLYLSKLPTKEQKDMFRHLMRSHINFQLLWSMTNKYDKKYNTYVHRGKEYISIKEYNKQLTTHSDSVYHYGLEKLHLLNLIKYTPSLKYAIETIDKSIISAIREFDKLSSGNIEMHELVNIWARLDQKVKEVINKSVDLQAIIDIDPNKVN